MQAPATSPASDRHQPNIGGTLPATDPWTRMDSAAASGTVFSAGSARRKSPASARYRSRSSVMTQLISPYSATWARASSPYAVAEKVATENWLPRDYEHLGVPMVIDLPGVSALGRIPG